MDKSIELPPFRLLLLDDHQVFIQGLAELIRLMSPESEIVLSTNEASAKEHLAKMDFQFLLTDINIPGANILEFTKNCISKYPNMTIIMLSSNTDMCTIKSYFNLGIAGYLSKAINSNELKIALEKTHKGERYISSDLTNMLATALFKADDNLLTKKEMEIIKHVAAGHSVNNTAALLNLSPYTVLAHRRNIMKKLGLHSAAELVKYAYDNNLQ
jgi:DNA-binding NarL/FixJ family response regulator